MRKMVLILAAVAVVAIGLWPPFEETIVVDRSSMEKPLRIEQPSRPGFLFAPPRTIYGLYDNRQWTEYSIDVGMLLAEWAVLAVATGLLLLAARGGSRGERRPHRMDAT